MRESDMVWSKLISPSIVLTGALFIFLSISGTVLAGEEVTPLKCALGGAFYAKAELALLKGEFNKGKVYLAAAHEADPSIPSLELKAMDMMHLEFPFVPEVAPAYENNSSRPSGFSKDQRFFGFCKSSGVTRFDLDTGESKKVPLARNILTLRLKVSPKGKFIVISDNRGNLDLYDMDSEIHVGGFAFRKDSPRSLTSIKMAFSPDGKTIIACYDYSDDQSIHFLSTEDLSITKTFPLKTRKDKPIRYLNDKSVLMNLDSKMVIADSSTMKIIKTLAPGWGWDADYLVEKNRIAVGGWCSIVVFDTKTQEKVAEYKAASHNIVLVRYLAGGRYLVYASPKGESGIIDCASGKVVQVFHIGRYASVSQERYLLFAQGKVIDLSACCPYQGVFETSKPQAVNYRAGDVPDSIGRAMEATSEKGLRKTSGRVPALVVKSPSGRLGVFGTKSDGRTFIYEYDKPGKVESVTSDLTNITTEVKMVVTDHYRTVIDLLFFADESYLVRLCKTGNGMAGAVEVYSLSDGKRTTLKLDVPPVSIKIFEQGRVVIVLDGNNRVFLSTLPNLDRKIQLLGATQIKRQIYVDQQTRTLAVMTGEQIDSYDLHKILPDSIISKYEDASKRFGVSLKGSEPLWDLLKH